MTKYPADLESYVQGKIDSGEFESREAFAVAAAKVFRELDQERESLKADIEAAIEEADRGETAPLNMSEIKEEVVRTFRARS